MRRVASLAVILVVGLGVVERAGAALAIVNGVPDWNQPTLLDNNLPDPGTVIAVNIPAVGGVTTAWCVPTTAANIAGYYRDTMAGLTIADGSAFPNTTARVPNAADWRDDQVDDLSAFPAVSRNDFGWYLNTNSQGDGTLINGGPGGTHYGNVLPGIANYYVAHNLASLIFNFADLAGPAVVYDSGAGGPHDVPTAYQRIQTEIDNGRPVMLHLSYWNLVAGIPVRGVGPAGLPNYDWGTWGGMPVGGTGPGGEVYGVDIGHTVTIVGYWDGADGNNPFIGMGDGGANPDALIVYDDSDGTLLLGGGAVGPLPVVIPFAAGQVGIPGLNVPWVMQTEISGVPEPATLALVALGLAGLAARRRRK